MRSSDGRYREHGANQCPARASHVHLPEEIRSNLSLLSRNAQPYLLACALPSGSKGIGRYTPETRAVLQCDEADRRVKNRTIAVMERWAQPGFAALRPEGSASTDTVMCAKVRIRRWRMEVGRGANASLLFVEHVVDGRVRSGRIPRGVAGCRARP
jgi:hypothetical protein